MNALVSRLASPWLAVVSVALVLGVAGPAHAQATVRLVNLECVKPLEKDGDSVGFDIYNGPTTFLRSAAGPLRAGQVQSLDRNVQVTATPWFALVRQIPGGQGKPIGWFEMKHKPGLHTQDIKWKGAHYRLQYEWVR